MSHISKVLTCSIELFFCLLLAAAADLTRLLSLSLNNTYLT